MASLLEGLRATAAARWRGRVTPDSLSSAVSIVALWLLVLSSHRGSVSLLERPTQSAAIVLLGIGIGLSCASLLLTGSIDSSKDSRRRRIEQGRSDLSFATIYEEGEQDGGGDSGDLLAPSERASSTFYPATDWWTSSALIAVILVLRLYAFRAILRDSQCRIAGVEAFVPILTALLDHFATRPPKHLPALDHLPTSQKALRSVGSACVVAVANNLKWRSASSPRSTIICPATQGTTRWVIEMQILGVLIDAWFLHSIPFLLAALRFRQTPAHAKRPFLRLGALFLVSSCALFAYGSVSMIFLRFRPGYPNLSFNNLSDILLSVLLSVILSMSGTLWASYHTGTDIAILLSCIITGSQLWYEWTGVLRTSTSQSLILTPLSIVLLCLGTALYIHSTGYAVLLNCNARRLALRFALFVLGASALLAFVFRGHLDIGSGQFYDSHPIDKLIDQASAAHKTWLTQASTSTTLEQAVENYVERYGRHPPPGFNKWYEFAVARKSYVIDDFDGIDENLKVFWKIEPRALRMRLKQLLLDTKHDCAEVSIRNGEALIGNVIPTHRWMVEGITIMMQPFVKDLPDMDLAFNINDEPRVAIPYETTRSLDEVNEAPENRAQLRNDWRKDLGKSWELSNDLTTDLDMEVTSFKRIFLNWGSVACPPSSPALTAGQLDPTVTCTSCYEPHSFQHFLSNWTLAAVPCHQPDLANLHGFYLSPSAFNPTHEVLPIFSQSRAGGFADILYPTAWNYNDKVKLDPSSEFPDDEFERKENTLFWRGTASEGFSRRGTWRGHARQRLVHLANNSTVRSSVLLKDNNGYRYSELTTAEFMQHPHVQAANLSLAVGFANGFTRCDFGDCEKQEAAFGLFPSIDFQYHWRHKFLLDADGAGFSGRFLPFLQSNSVPLKSAIFREWYDSRLTPWKHFVPVDVRFLNLWSILAYFGGGLGNKWGDPAKTIAREGREWASKVLRKEDMEIYCYRLLLEYARVMDDDRTKLGYS